MKYYFLRQNSTLSNIFDEIWVGQMFLPMNAGRSNVIDKIRVRQMF